jgi:GNAT superfamily N-acetyltransferase
VRQYIRDARVGDELRVAQVHVRSWQSAYAGLIDAEFLSHLSAEHRASRYQFVLPHLKAPRTRLLIRDESIIGFATSGASPDDHAEGAGQLLALYVDPPMWSTGAGLCLMSDARQCMSEVGFDRATLWVLDGNRRAIAFYERDGWQLDDTERHENWGTVTLHEHRMATKLI